MHNHPDKENILITLDQLDQTLEVLIGVVSRLKKDIDKMEFTSTTDIEAEETTKGTEAKLPKSAEAEKNNVH